MSTIHLRASVENGRLVSPLPPELAGSATDGTTFDIALDLPEAHLEEAPLPKPGDSPEAFLRYFETLRSLGDLVLPPQDGHLDLPRHALREAG